MVVNANNMVVIERQRVRGTALSITTVSSVVSHLMLNRKDTVQYALLKGVAGSTALEDTAQGTTPELERVKTCLSQSRKFLLLVQSGQIAGDMSRLRQLTDGCLNTVTSSLKVLVDCYGVMKASITKTGLRTITELRTWSFGLDGNPLDSGSQTRPRGLLNGYEPMPLNA